MEDLPVSVTMNNVMNFIVLKDTTTKIVVSRGFCLVCFAHISVVRKTDGVCVVRWTCTYVLGGSVN